MSNKDINIIFFDLFVTTALRLKLLLQARRVGFEKSVLPKKIIFISLFDIAWFN